MKTNELTKVIETSGLEVSTSSQLKEAFMPFFDQAQQWKEKAMKVVVTSEDQIEEMKQAREARLALKSIRVEADKKRKFLKEDSLRYGKAVQGVYNVIDYLIAPIEKHLEDQEKFIEIQKQKKIESLNQQRISELSPYAEFVPIGLDLGNMKEEDFKKLLNGAKVQKEQQEAEEKREQQARIEREQKEREAQELMRVENERLKKEAEEREKKAEAERKAITEKAEEERKKIAAEKKIAEEKASKERAEAEAKLKVEREARQALEKEAEDRRKKEEDARKKIEAEERKAALAPDKKKLLSLADLVDSILIPELKEAESIKVANHAKELLLKTSSFIREKSVSL